MLDENSDRHPDYWVWQMNNNHFDIWMEVKMAYAEGKVRKRLNKALMVISNVPSSKFVLPFWRGIINEVLWCWPCSFSHTRTHGAIKAMKWIPSQYVTFKKHHQILRINCNLNRKSIHLTSIHQCVIYKAVCCFQCLGEGRKHQCEVCYGECVKLGNCILTFKKAPSFEGGKQEVTLKSAAGKNHCKIYPSCIAD